MMQRFHFLMARRFIKEHLGILSTNFVVIIVYFLLVGADNVFKKLLSDYGDFRLFFLTERRVSNFLSITLLTGEKD